MYRTAAPVHGVASASGSFSMCLSVLATCSLDMLAMPAVQVGNYICNYVIAGSKFNV